MTRLVKPLFEGPLDVVGDIHGEKQALDSLLNRLGYDRHGEHRQGRRLVFVGDLVDRGPDSPAVLRLVQQLVERELAQCVVGNHELNLLRKQPKHGNHWFFGEPSPGDIARFGECAWLTPPEQPLVLEFLESLPLALERPDLRVVHAAWHDESVSVCRNAAGSALAAYCEHNERVEAELVAEGIRQAAMAEQESIGAALQDPSSQVPLLPHLAHYDSQYQLRNPVRVISSGVERPAATPFYASGKWRMVERVPWWRDYAHGVPVIFGHYWRWWSPDGHRRYSKGEANLFADVDRAGWLPTAGREGAFCLDYSVGARFQERKEGLAEPFHGRLAAMRWPERELVFDTPH